MLYVYTELEKLSILSIRFPSCGRVPAPAIGGHTSFQFYRLDSVLMSAYYRARRYATLSILSIRFWGLQKRR